MPSEVSRSRAARLAAETALVRVVHHYGARPEFVLMGGLMPDYLCSSSSYQHAGTTDVDVQVDLEIARGTVNVRRLENALRNAEFRPDSENVWRWAVREEGGSAGPEEAARAVLDRFEADIRGATRTAVLELDANFMEGRSQGPRAYVEQMIIDHPNLDRATVAADSVVAVKTFCRIVTGA